MPMKPKRPCSHPNCPNLTDKKYCDEHKALHPDRPPSYKRGYNYRWNKVRKEYLNKHPLCVKCLSEGKYVQATVVDHIIPHRGNDDLMWDTSNYQALCKRCHDTKTWTEDRNPVYTLETSEKF
jgi:5-methylcytosine-specific restriction protein A